MWCNPSYYYLIWFVLWDIDVLNVISNIIIVPNTWYIQYSNYIYVQKCIMISKYHYVWIANDHKLHPVWKMFFCRKRTQGKPYCVFTFCWSEVYWHQRDDETRIYALALFTILNMYLLRVLTHIIRLIVPHRVFPQLCTMEHLFIFFIAFALMDEMCFTFGIHDIGILLYFTKAGKRSWGKNVQKLFVIVITIVQSIFLLYLKTPLALWAMQLYILYDMHMNEKTILLGFVYLSCHYLTQVN